MNIKPRIYYSKITQQWHWYWWDGKKKKIADPRYFSRGEVSKLSASHAHNFVHNLNAKQERLV